MQSVSDNPISIGAQLYVKYCHCLDGITITLFTRSLQLEMRHPRLKIRDYCSFQSPRKCICLSVAPV